MESHERIVLKKHTLSQSIFLHLFPGVLTVSFYFLFISLIQGSGLPTVAAFILSAIFVLIPVELGIIYWAKSRSSDQITIKSIIKSSKLKKLEYILYCLGLIIIMGIIVMLLEPIDLFLEETVFAFFPEQLKFNMGMSSEYSRTGLFFTYLVGLFILAGIAPIVEEIYFRGYLLPRIPDLKGFDKILHSFLFACYHMWTPWMIISRTIFMIPFIYVVSTKKNMYIAFFVHCFVNMLDFISGFVFLLSL